MKIFTSLFLLLLILTTSTVVAQEVRAQVLDAVNKQPVAYANVIFAPNRGVVTNEEGFFSYNPENEKQPELLAISSLGYEGIEIAPKDISNGTIFLKPSSIELREVYLSNKNLSPKEIIKKVKEEVANNYDFDLSKKRVFFRQSDVSYIRKFDLHVDESTIEGIDQNLMNEISRNVPKMSDSYKEVLADLYGNFDSQKVQIIKAANLHNPQSTQSLNQLTDKLEQLFKDNLKKDSYLKIRSGIIGVKMDAKELQEEMAANEEEKEEKTPEQKEKERIDSQKSLQKSANRKMQSLLSNMFWKEDITFNLFDKTNKYKFSLEGYAYIDNATVYVINFEPKRGADYKGKIYVNAHDFGVHRLDYENVKPLKKFRLFGIRTADDVYRGKMIFAKNEAGKYSVHYLERETGESVGIDRPLTIIEKNKVVPGRNKQNELDLDIDIRVSQVEKLQLVVFSSEAVENASFESLAASDQFDYQTFKVYNPEFWNGYNIMEPNAAIKQFTALQAE